MSISFSCSLFQCKRTQHANPHLDESALLDYSIIVSLTLASATMTPTSQSSERSPSYSDFIKQRGIMFNIPSKIFNVPRFFFFFSLYLFFQFLNVFKALWSCDGCRQLRLSQSCARACKCSHWPLLPLKEESGPWMPHWWFWEKNAATLPASHYRSCMIILHTFMDLLVMLALYGLTAVFPSGVCPGIFKWGNPSGALTY